MRKKLCRQITVLHTWCTRDADHQNLINWCTKLKRDAFRRVTDVEQYSHYTAKSFYCDSSYLVLYVFDLWCTIRFSFSCNNKLRPFCNDHAVN